MDRKIQTSSLARLANALPYSALNVTIVHGVVVSVLVSVSEKRRSGKGIGVVSDKHISISNRYKLSEAH